MLPIVTKNESGVLGEDICGCCYGLLKSFDIIDNNSEYMHRKFFLVDVGTWVGSDTCVRIEPGKASVVVENVYSGYHFPDIGKTMTITGEVRIGKMVYRGVCLDNLFLPYPEEKNKKYKPNNNLIHRIEGIHRKRYNKKQIPVLYETKKDILRNYGFMEKMAIGFGFNEKEVQKLSKKKLENDSFPDII